MALLTNLLKQSAAHSLPAPLLAMAKKFGIDVNAIEKSVKDIAFAAVSINERLAKIEAAQKQILNALTTTGIFVAAETDKPCQEKTPART